MESREAAELLECAAMGNEGKDRERAALVLGIETDSRYETGIGCFQVRGVSSPGRCHVTVSCSSPAPIPRGSMNWIAL